MGRVTRAPAEVPTACPTSACAGLIAYAFVHESGKLCSKLACTGLICIAEKSAQLTPRSANFVSFLKLDRRCKRYASHITIIQEHIHGAASGGCRQID